MRCYIITARPLSVWITYLSIFGRCAPINLISSTQLCLTATLNVGAFEFTEAGLIKTKPYPTTSVFYNNSVLFGKARHVYMDSYPKAPISDMAKPFSMQFQSDICMKRKLYNIKHLLLRALI